MGWSGAQTHFRFASWHLLLSQLRLVKPGFILFLLGCVTLEIAIYGAVNWTIYTCPPDGLTRNGSAIALRCWNLAPRPIDRASLQGRRPRIYWLEDVLVSLVLVVDGEAITKAVTWGIEQERANFQIVVLSLFKAAFAEVSYDDDKKPIVKVSGAVDLSPLRADYCVSTHPRMRPELKPGMKIQHQRGERIMQSNSRGSRQRLQSQFPGLAALVNFFEVAANRRAASKPGGILPPELYDRILDFVDYDTWKTCLLVSTVFRSWCLRKYRLDDRMRIVGGPFVRLRKYHEERLASFDFENIQTGTISSMTWVPHDESMEEYNWMPVIGSDRRALMLDVSIQFEPAGDVPVEADSDDERV